MIANQEKTLSEAETQVRRLAPRSCISQIGSQTLAHFTLRKEVLMRFLFGLVTLCLLGQSVLAVADDKKSDSEKPKTKKTKIGSAFYAVPTDWKKEKPKNSFRLGQYSIPPAKGDSVGAEFVVFFFGKGQGGGVDANIKRWSGMFQDKKREEKKAIEVGAMKITTLDIEGTYKFKPAPFAPKATLKRDHRMFAAILPTRQGSYFVRLVGPTKTVTAEKKNWETFLKSYSRD